jgi:Uma2 family endonuclease
MPTRLIKETATEYIYADTVQFTVPKIQISTADLPAEDGLPLESNWQRAQMNLLIELINIYWADRTDFYAGGNMFIYYSPNRLKTEDGRGPDFFVVKGVDKARAINSDP